MEEVVDVRDDFVDYSEVGLRLNLADLVLDPSTSQMTMFDRWSSHSATFQLISMHPSHHHHHMQSTVYFHPESVVLVLNVFLS